MSQTSCATCKGSGHDKGSQPVIKFVLELQDDGTYKRVHKTIKQGSGCCSCHGLGHK
jgi:hypothetical protein